MCLKTFVHTRVDFVMRGPTKRESERPRIALYSHDTMGLGHMRRNTMLAHTFAKSRLEPNVLLFSGAMEARSFFTPPGVDFVTLPSLHKEQDGKYTPRRLDMSLQELISIRRKTLMASVTAFDPHLLIVDTAPWGVSGELDSTLEQLATVGRTRLVLGMRDVWDDPAVISHEWESKDNWEAIKRYYDQVWVYGDASVYDTLREYRVEEGIKAKFRYTGYLGRTTDSQIPTIDYADDTPDFHLGPFCLCLMGGGQDGVRLAETFLEADIPVGRTGVLITGPFIDSKDLEHLRKVAAERARVRVIHFLPEPLPMVMAAESIISMGGYNAVCEILSFKKRALIVPRVKPRREQLIRAERFRDLGYLDVLHPDDLDPGSLSEFLKSSSAPKPTAPVDLNGLARVSDLAESLLATGTQMTRER